MSYVLENNGLGLLTGEVGSGKATLIGKLLTSLDDMKFLMIYICGLGLKPKDFYGQLVVDMGEAMPFGLSKARKLWNKRAQAQGGMSEDMIQELRFVRNQDMDAKSPFPLIRVGQPEMR